jgi:hypothetical protein
MKKISSPFTPILKYFIPWSTFALLGIGMFAAINNEESSLAIATLIIGIPVVAFMRAMLMDLRTVHLDVANQRLYIGNKKTEIVNFDDIVEILLPSTPPYIVSVKTNRKFSFGKRLMFIPNEHPMFLKEIDKSLNIKTRTP